MGQPGRTPDQSAEWAVAQAVSFLCFCSRDHKNPELLIHSSEGLRSPEDLLLLNQTSALKAIKGLMYVCNSVYNLA